MRLAEHHAERHLSCVFLFLPVSAYVMSNAFRAAISSRMSLPMSSSEALRFITRTSPIDGSGNDFQHSDNNQFLEITHYEVRHIVILKIITLEPLSD
jgi:hypothetical protein